MSPASSSDAQPPDMLPSTYRLAVKANSDLRQFFYSGISNKERVDDPSCRVPGWLIPTALYIILFDAALRSQWDGLWGKDDTVFIPGVPCS